MTVDTPPIEALISKLTLTDEGGEPRLPTELECEIFRHVYYDALPKDRPSLLLVAKRVSTWLIPLLYQSVIVNNSNVPPLNSLQKYGHHVRHIYMDGSGCGFSLDATLFPNASNVNLWYGARATEDIFDVPVKRLFLHYLDGFHGSLTSLHDTDRVKKWCSNVTHLGWGTINESACPLLAYFPNLTHLLIGAWNTAGMVGEALKYCPQVKVVIWLLSGYRSDNESSVVEGATERDPAFDDYRVVTMDGYLFKDWVRGTEGEVDMWEIAQKKVEERKALKVF